MLQRKNKGKTLWVVVKVGRGIPELIEIFSDYISAKRREHHLRKHMHPDYDETGLFEIKKIYSRWFTQHAPDYTCKEVIKISKFRLNESRC